MLHAIHLLLVLAYALLPVGMVWWTLGRRARTRRAGPIISLLMLFFIGIVTGILLLLLNIQLMTLTQPAAVSGGGFGGARLVRVSTPQISLRESARLIYFVIGALCLIRLVDRVTF